MPYLRTSAARTGLVLCALAAVVLAAIGTTSAMPVGLPHRPAVARTIVPDLTEYLDTVLSRHGVNILMVFSPSAAAPNETSVLDWQRLRTPQRVAMVHSYGDVSAAADVALREAAAQYVHTRGSSTQYTAQPSSSGGVGVRPTVALLLLTVDGAPGIGQTALAAAAARRLARHHLLTLAYSRNAAKANSLLVMNRQGVPLEAGFAETSIFRDAFNEVYKTKAWTSDGGGSGSGSTLKSTTTIREELPKLIARYSVSSMLDSSCGSMHWMPLVLAEVTASQPSFRFHGTDVVCGLIDQHRVTFANMSGSWKFDCVDYSAQPLPRGYDLVYSRDSLQHVPLHAALMFLANVRASGAKLLLVGSYLTWNTPNVDIKAGEYYSIDLTKPPFNLGPPLEVINEKTPDGKHMLLFNVTSMTWDDWLPGLL